jgi:hypothetical protein
MLGSDEEYLPGEKEDSDPDTDENDNMVTEANYKPIEPSEEQLSQISFEANRSGRFNVILVDGTNYRQVFFWGGGAII